MVVITAQDTPRISVRRQPISRLTGKRSVKDARTPEHHAAEQRSNTALRSAARQDPEYRAAEQRSDTERRFAARFDARIQNELEAYAAHYEAEHTYPPAVTDQTRERDRTCVRTYWQKVLQFMDKSDAACAVCGQLSPRAQCNEWKVEQLVV